VGGYLGQAPRRGGCTVSGISQRYRERLFSYGKVVKGIKFRYQDIKSIAKASPHAKRVQVFLGLVPAGCCIIEGRHEINGKTYRVVIRRGSSI